MGQDDTTIEDPSTGIYYDSSGNVVSPPVITPIVAPTNVLDFQAPTNIGSAPSTGSPAIASNPSGSLNLSQLVNSVSAAAANAGKLYNSLQTPALIAGTNAIYNAATGQYYNPTTGQVVNANGTGVVGTLDLSSISAYLPSIMLFGGLAVGAFLLIRMTGGGR
jgi:hypothetical protein